MAFHRCWYGLFFELEAKDKAVEITGLWTQTGMYWMDVRDKMDVRVYSKEGVARGFETAPEAWTVRDVSLRIIVVLPVLAAATISFDAISPWSPSL